MTSSIRIIDYNGDLDTMNEVFLVGPYESDDAADAEASRLQELSRDADGDYDFEVTHLRSDDMADPAPFSAAATGTEFESAFTKAFYGFDSAVDG